jgi:PAS domain S-box-containing protein
VLLDHLPAAAYRCEVEPPWRMEFMSEGIAPITGYAAGEYMTGRFRQFSDAIHPEDLGQVERIVAECVAAGRPYEMEYRLSHAMGGWRWVFERGCAVPGEGGRPVWLEGIFLDITARREAEEHLHDAKLLAHDILDSLTANVAVVDEHGTILTVNRAWREFAAANGASESLREGVGLSYLPGVEGRGGRTEWEGVRRVLRGELPVYRSEYACNSPSEQRWFELCALPLTGVRRGAVIAHENITARRVLEQALHESEERFRTLTEIMSDFAYQYRLREDGEFVREWQGAGRMDYLKMHGLDGRVGESTQSILPYIHPEDLPRFEARVARLCAGEAQVTEYRLRFPDGATRHMRDYGKPLLDGDGRVTGVVGAIQDITEQRTAELERERLAGELLQAQKLESLGRLAGGVAHDFNNLLTVINGYAQLLLARLPAGDRCIDGLTQIRRAGDRAAELVEQLLIFSRRQRLQPQVLDLGRTVAELRGMLARLVGEDIGVTVETGPGCLNVSADPGQVQQILLNLAANARDAMPGGGRLAVSVTADGEARHVRLTVADTGAGMDRETQSHLFEPFFTTKGPGRGTGLGLATVHGIVAQSGGRIEVRSAPGEGTVFRIELPAVGAAPAVAATLEKPRATGGSETILVVEDRADVRTVTAAALGSFGYRVLEAEGGRQGLEMLRGGGVDLLLTDVVMPGLGGGELARLARLERPGLKVVFMSGYWGDAEILPDSNGRGDGLLRKPFHVDELAAVVRRALGGRATG